MIRIKKMHGEKVVKNWLQNIADGEKFLYLGVELIGQRDYNQTCDDCRFKNCSYCDTYCEREGENYTIKFVKPEKYKPEIS